MLTFGIGEIVLHCGQIITLPLDVFWTYTASDLHFGQFIVDDVGIEPTASALQVRRSPN